MPDSRATADLAALERLAKAATPGPWKGEGEQVFIGAGMSKVGIAWALEANAAYIAAVSPDVVLGLIEQVRAVSRPAVGEEGLRTALRELVAYAEMVSDGYAILRTEPPYTSTQTLKERIAAGRAALATADKPEDSDA